MRSTVISRREALRRMILLAAGTGIPFSFAAASDLPAPWVDLDLATVSVAGYGTDPELIHPLPAPWPGTLTDGQQHLISTLADMLMPADGTSPSASEVGVVEVLDEWVSAPYPDQQTHRVLILSGLSWCNAESQRQFGRQFVKLEAQKQLTIIDQIAYPTADDPADEAPPVQFFSLLRALVVGIYYTSPEGVRELGYQGNVPISGDYPGPSPAALQHLSAIKTELGLD